MRQILLTTLCLLAVLVSCQAPGSSTSTITFKRADISGAKFVTIAGDEASGRTVTATRRLYKIDESGAITAVVFYIQVDQDGNKTTETSTAEHPMTPRKITDLGQGYLLFLNCDTYEWRSKYNVEGRYDHIEQHFLVRKSDGAIFEVTEEQLQYFPDPQYFPTKSNLVTSMQLTYNARGELYMVGVSGVVSKLKLENEGLFIQQLTSKEAVSARIMIDKNDILCSGKSNLMYSSKTQMYAADGSVATYPSTRDQGYVLLIDHEYYLFESTYDGKTDQLTCKLSKTSFSVPTLKLEEIATATATGSYRINQFAFIDAGSKVLLVSDNREEYLVFDKSTKKLSILSAPVEFQQRSEKQYDTRGIAYVYSKQQCTRITRYNIVDMTQKTIDCDRSALPPFIQTKTQTTATDFFEFGVKTAMALRFGCKPTSKPAKLPCAKMPTIGKLPN